MTKDYSMMSRFAALLLAGSAMFSTAAADQLKVLEASPADNGCLLQLRRVNLTLEGETNVGVEWKSGLKAPVRNSSGEEVTYVTGAYAGSFSLRLKQTLTEPGTYTIDIPAGAFYTPDWDQQVYPIPAVPGTENDAFTLTYTIVDKEPIAFDSAEPEDNAVVSRLSQIVCYWVNTTPDYGFDIEVESVAVLAESGDKVATATAERNFLTLLLTLDTPIEANGTYTLTLPEGMIYGVSEEGNRILDDSNKQVKLTYTVDETVGVQSMHIEEKNICVADGRIVTEGLQAPDIAVYSPSGIRMDNSSRLAPGMYIVKASDGGTSIVKRVIVK